MNLRQRCLKAPHQLRWRRAWWLLLLVYWLLRQPSQTCVRLLRLFRPFAIPQGISGRSKRFRRGLCRTALQKRAEIEQTAEGTEEDSSRRGDNGWGDAGSRERERERTDAWMGDGANRNIENRN